MPYFVVDAFASEPLTGNPAAVVFDADGLSDSQMQAVAAEFNLSETTFVLPTTKADVQFRWFTPTIEVDMCGHATIAGVHALAETGRLPVAGDSDSTPIRIDTRSGTLTAFVEAIPGSAERMIWLDLIDPTIERADLPTIELAKSLGLGEEAFEASLPMCTTQDRDVLAFVRDVQVLNEAKPDLAALKSLLENHDLRGLSLATVKTLTPSINVQSRFFAPAAGVNEDPVTGSVHGPLAVYLVSHDLVPVHEGLAAMTCMQGIPGGRSGVLYALVQPKGGEIFSVRIGGKAHTSMRGVFTL